ncbi:MAG: ABC transporter substrate-binding protein [Anaerolineales bacterium]|nr:ABC transporter substrate-binding protein [Anaerolineales bacterium]
MFKTQIYLVLAILSLSMLLSACAPAASPQPTATTAPQPTAPLEPTGIEVIKLKVSTLPFVSYAPFFIAQEEGLFAEQGLEVEFVKIDKTSEAMAGLAQGQIDVAAGFFDVSTLNAIAKGGQIKYVSDKGYLDTNGCDASTFVARKDLLESGKLDDLKNLAGMKIALTPTSTAEYALDVLLKGVGLSSKDVEVLDIPLPARLEGMGSGSVDIAATSDPWTIRMVNAGSGVVWNPWQKLMPNLQFSIIMYGPNLLEKNRDAGVRFLIAYLKAVKQYHEGKTDRNVEIIAKYTQLKVEEVKQSCWMSMRADGSVNLDGMDDFQQWALDKGYLVSIVPEDQLLDLGFLEAANQALK